MKIFYTLTLHFSDNKFPAMTYIKEFLEQSIFLNPHTKLNFSSNDPYFYSILAKYIIYKITIIRDLFRFLHSCLISYMRLEEKLGHTCFNSETIYM